MSGRIGARLAVVFLVAAIILAGVGQVQGRAPKGMLRIPPQPIKPMLNEITDLLATPHQPTANDIQLEWTEVPGATQYNVYRSTSVRGDGFNFAMPYAIVPGDGMGKIIFTDALAYATYSNYSWVVRPVIGGEEGGVSNPAWKLVYTLIWGIGVAGYDQNYISLPFRLNLTYGANVNNGAALIGDMRAYGSPTNSVTSVNKWNQTTGVWNTRTAIVGINFPLKAGEGYRVVVNVPAVTYKIVGAHDPNIVYNFIIGTGTVAPDQNYISLPYHFNLTQGTWYNLSAALLSNIRTYGLPTNSATSVARWSQDLSYWQPRTTIAGTNFQLKPGECYRVIVSQVIVTWDCPVAIWGA